MCRTGRPTRLTPELQDRICEHLLKCIPVRTALQLADVPERDYYFWLEKAEEGSKLHQDFLQSVKRASAAAESDTLKSLQTTSKGWERYAWVLERRFKDEWAKTQNINSRNENINTNTDPIAELAKTVPTEKIRQIVAILKAENE